VNLVVARVRRYGAWCVLGLGSALLVPLSCNTSRNGPPDARSAPEVRGQPTPSGTCEPCKRCPETGATRPVACVLDDAADMPNRFHPETGEVISLGPFSYGSSLRPPALDPLIRNVGCQECCYASDLVLRGCASSTPCPTLSMKVVSDGYRHYGVPLFSDLQPRFEHQDIMLISRERTDHDLSKALGAFLAEWPPSPGRSANDSRTKQAGASQDSLTVPDDWLIVGVRTEPGLDEKARPRGLVLGALSELPWPVRSESDCVQKWGSEPAWKIYAIPSLRTLSNVPVQVFHATVGGQVRDAVLPMDVPGALGNTVSVTLGVAVDRRALVHAGCWTLAYRFQLHGSSELGEVRAMACRLGSDGKGRCEFSVSGGPNTTIDLEIFLAPSVLAIAEKAIRETLARTCYVLPAARVLARDGSRPIRQLQFRFAKQ
jgi:hypothetical protein